jgi:hypothetical protein
MQIVVSVLLPDPVNEAVQGPPPKGPGKRFVFSKDLVLERLDNSTPGPGPLDLPPDPLQRHAGTYSGFVTVLRVAEPLDVFLQPGTYLLNYEVVYRFTALANTSLQKGQITAHGVFYGFAVSGHLQTVDPPNGLAITGGTEAYTTAHGQIIQQPNPPNAPADEEIWLLDIP